MTIAMALDPTSTAAADLHHQTPAPIVAHVETDDEWFCLGNRANLRPESVRAIEIERRRIFRTIERINKQHASYCQPKTHEQVPYRYTYRHSTEPTLSHDYY